MTINTYEIILRLIISVAIGGVIGLEREHSTRPAGFRTHILVTIGSTVVMIISALAFDPLGNGNDPMRLAANVITGIGFLGAGTIMQKDSDVKGLTTAASLWTCGGLGLAIGAGLYSLGIIAALIVVLTLSVLGRLDYKMSKIEMQLQIIRDLHFGGLEDIKTLLDSYDLTIAQIQVKKISKKSKNQDLIGDIYISLSTSSKKIGTLSRLVENIMALPGVNEVKIIK